MDISDPVTLYYLLSFATSSIIIVLAAMLLGVHIPNDEKLTNFRFAKRYLSLSYFVLGISGFVGFFLQREAEDEALMVICILIIASYQALLFTYTILALIQPLYVKRKQIFIQLGIITITSILLLLSLSFASHILYTLFFYILAGAYLLQISYYTYIFILKYNICIQSLEEYYEDDERTRLQWVSFSFYSALTIGILALVSLFLSFHFYILFSILYTAYYAYMVNRFYNYQIDFKFAIPVINQDTPIESKTDTNPAQTDNQTLDEKYEHLRHALDQWLEQKKFTLKDVSVDEIAHSLGINRSYLQYYFRTYMQTDFRTWRSKLRIYEAQTILKENPDISLENVREMVGFNHRANFHQQFQKITGLTPTEYRQQYSKQS